MITGFGLLGLNASATARNEMPVSLVEETRDPEETTDLLQLLALPRWCPPGVLVSSTIDIADSEQRGMVYVKCYALFANSVFTLDDPIQNENVQKIKVE